MTEAFGSAVPGVAAQPVMLAVVLVVPVALALGGRRDAAACWLQVVGGALALVVLLKLLGALLWPMGGVLRSPSGHAAAGGLVWGGAALAAGLARRTALAIGAALTLAVGAARVASGLHSAAEVVVGGAIGLLALLLLAQLLPAPPPGWRALPLLAAVALAVLVAAPWELQPEPMIHALAHWLRAL